MLFESITRSIFKCKGKFSGFNTTSQVIRRAAMIMSCYKRAYIKNQKVDIKNTMQKSKMSTVSLVRRKIHIPGLGHTCRFFAREQLFLNFDLWFCILIFNP